MQAHSTATGIPEKERERERVVGLLAVDNNLTEEGGKIWSEKKVATLTVCVEEGQVSCHCV